jgi:hypothetical protein
MIYLVLEIQSDGNTASVLPWTFKDNLQGALAKFYTVCSAMAVSKVPIHSCMIITDSGELIKQEKFYHEGVAE